MNGSLFPELEREETPAPAKPGAVSFVVYGIPVGQPRATPSAIYRRGPDGKPQLITRPGHDGREVPMMRMVNAQREGKADIGTWRSMLSYAAVEAWGARPFIAENAVVLIAKFYFPRVKRLLWKSKPMPSEPMATKPDLKNLLWAVEDSLTGIVWRDDAQICSYGDSGKWYVPGPGYGDGRARVEVTVEVI